MFFNYQKYVFGRADHLGQNCAGAALGLGLCRSRAGTCCTTLSLRVVRRLVLWVSTACAAREEAFLLRATELALSFFGCRMPAVLFWTSLKECARITGKNVGQLVGQSSFGGLAWQLWQLSGGLKFWPRTYTSKTLHQGIRRFSLCFDRSLDRSQACRWRCWFGRQQWPCSGCSWL